MTAAKLDLVHLAVRSGILGNIQWKTAAAALVRADKALAAIPPERIRLLLHQFVLVGNSLDVRTETREDYIAEDPDHPFWYRAIIPVSGFFRWGSSSRCVSLTMTPTIRGLKSSALINNLDEGGTAMDRDYSTKCSKCRERAVSLASVAYRVQVENDGRTYDVVIPDLVVPRCEKCGNYVLHDEANQRITAEFRKIAGLLTPDEIRFHRERIGLSQDALADYLGVTAPMLSRWESGELIQPRSLDRFLRAILTMPELRKNLADEHALELTSAS